MAVGSRSVERAEKPTVTASASGYLRWPYLVGLGLLAVVNAVVFPLRTGYSGGAAPVTAPETVAWHVGLAAVNAAALLAIAFMPGERVMRLRYLLLLAAFTRLAYLVVRMAQGAGAVDPDVQLFFRYGQEFAAGKYPSMEYPQLALLLFTGAFLVSSGDAGRFAIVFPLFTLVCELVTLAALFLLGERCRAGRAAAALGVFYALSPFTLVLWYGKFDALPAALLAVGTYWFAARRHLLSALALAAGFLAKWFPGIAIAFFALHLLRSGRRRLALTFTAVAAAAILLPIAYFWSLSPEKVLFTYRFHSGRDLIGESLLYIPVHMLEPAVKVTASTRPWDGVKSQLMTNDLGMALQFGAVGLALIVGAFVRRRESAIALAGVGVALFILLNRVFSPQYTLVLLVAYGLGLVALPLSRRLTAAALLALLALTLCNYFVWPLWTPFWVRASAAFFAIDLALVAWLGVRAMVAQRSAPDG